VLSSPPSTNEEQVKEDSALKVAAEVGSVNGPASAQILKGAPMKSVKFRLNLFEFDFIISNFNIHFQ
jgi:hypothetical protein